MPRTELVGRMLRAPEPVVSVVAPPGFGKSTLLRQWAERRGPRIAWVSCDRIHDDPVFLWTAIVMALSMIEAFDLEPARLDTSDDAVRLGELLVGMLDACPQPITLVFDQLETLTNPESRNLIAASALALPAGSWLAWASRGPLPFSLARMRVQGRVLEVGAADLAMSRSEASLMLRAEGAELSEEATARLVRQTEGWPAALYLAAWGVRTGGVSAAEGISGDYQPLRDYLRSEVLEQMSSTQVEFLMRTSILDRVNGELGEVVGGVGDAVRLLEGLHDGNLLVEPVDSRGEWYRQHPLLRQMLVAELRSGSPELVPRLHAQAAEWLHASSDLEAAIHHAHLSGDSDLFGRLVLEAMQPTWAGGRVDMVEDWVDRLGHHSPDPHTPAMIAHGALIFALLGRPGDAERWTAVAEGLPAVGSLPDGSTVAATMAYLRANLCREGAAVMRRDCAEALQGLSPTSPYRATMLHTEGLAALLEGDLEQADASFAHAYDLAVSIETSPVAALVLTEQALIAVERDEWSAANSLIKRSLEIVARGPFGSYWTSALVYASAARDAAHWGDMREAQEHVARATSLRPLLTYALPVVSVQALLELARAHLALTDQTSAKDTLGQVRGILRQRPDLGALVTATSELEARVDQVTKALPVGSSSLTPAELRIVPLLSTRLTMAEMGERLFVTRNTVKTHVVSLYRKLGVSSRDEAVERLVELGFISPPEK